MSRKSFTDEEILKRIDDSLADDVLTEAYTSDEVAEAIRQAGGDPEAIGRRGSALAAQLLEERRLSWRRAARERLAKTQNVESVRTKLAKLSRQGLLLALEDARREPSLKGLVGAFHKRKAEQSSDEELRALLQDIEMLRQSLSGKDKESGSKKD